MNLVLNYVFYLWLGFIGPAIATFISIAFIQLLQLIATSTQLKVKFSAIFPWKALGLLTFLNALLGVGFATLKEIIPLGKYIGNVAQAFVLGTVWMIVYLAITYRSIVKRWHILNEKYTA
jgi:O-antigen/teichoic acid export membrane protein